jgi:3-(3-hydroxy-phenyl)propionate hydroxylase
MARAVYTDDECMRVLQDAGVAEDVAKDMLVDTPVQWVRRDGSVIGQFIQTTRPQGWPILNFLYQPWFENTLEKLLDRYPNVTVRRGRQVVSLAQHPDSVTVVHAESSGTNYGKDEPVLGAEESLTARYLVAADGGRSTVRGLLGIEMTGTRYPDRWLVVDIKVKEDKQSFRHIPYFNFVCDPDLPTVSCPQPGGYHRFEFLLKDSQSTQHMEDPATVREHLAHYVDPDEVEVVRALVYQFNALVADSWRDGRVLLAGDAGHMTPQFMGQGMSSGIRDAHGLAWRLDAVMNRGASDRILDSYGSERAPHAKAMIDISVQMRDFVSLQHPVGAKLRNAFVITALRTPKVRDYFHEMRFKPGPAFEAGSFLGQPRGGRSGAQGRLFPQPTVRTIDGRHERLDDLTGAGFALIGIECDPTAYLPQRDLASWDRVGLRTLVLYDLGHRPQGMDRSGSRIGPGVIEVEDLHGIAFPWTKRHGIRKGDVVVLRPDGYVFAVVPASRVCTATAWLSSELGLPPVRERAEPRV